MCEHFLSGAARSGCWVCLDDFVRISQSVMSVAANLISSVYLAKKVHKLSIESTDVGNVGPLVVDPEFQIFTTTRVTKQLTYSSRPTTMTIICL